jgi:uncharacterized membrane protein YjjP (DUF1212 family)
VQCGGGVLFPRAELVMIHERDSDNQTGRGVRYADLTDIIDLALWAGYLLLAYGAECQRVEETVYRLSTAFGCDGVEVFVATNAIQLTVTSGGEFRTRIRRVHSLGVNMTTISAVSRLSRRVEQGELDRAAVRSELERISSMPHHYNRWMVAAMVGLACAAFSRLFGGDWAVFGVTFLSSWVGMLVRQELARRHFNMVLVVFSAAFVTSLLASSAALLHLSDHPEWAQAAAVLFLIPGVPLINAVGDLVKGHTVVGLARLTQAGMVVLSLALGLVLAIQITGVAGV